MVATSELPLVHTNLGLQHKYYQEVKAYVLTHHLEHMFEVRLVIFPVSAGRAGRAYACHLRLLRIVF
jgi:hypothetical protein